MIESTCDDFLGGRISCLQPKHGLRSGIDTILLAASVRAIKGQRVLEVGAGSGVASFALAARVSHLDIFTLEYEQGLAKLIEQNVALNSLVISQAKTRFEIINADWLTWQSQNNESFDHIFSNPPFEFFGETRLPSNNLKQRATTITRADFQIWLSKMAKLTKPGGEITIIHKYQHLDFIIENIKPYLQSIRVIPIKPKINSPAKRVILSGVVKQSRLDSPNQESEFIRRDMDPIVLHDENGEFTHQISQVLRSAQALY